MRGVRRDAFVLVVIGVVDGGDGGVGDVGVAVVVGVRNEVGVDGVVACC